MDLQTWRKAKNLTLQQAAPILGLSISSLSRFERHLADPSYEQIARIDGATAGQVTAADLFDAWRNDREVGNPKEFSTLRAAGRAAMKEFLSTAKKEGQRGRKR